MVGAEGALGVDEREVISGADRVVRLGDVPRVDARSWKPRAMQRLLEADGVRPVEVWSGGDGVLIVDADDERPLVLVTESVPEVGRWAANAVVVAAGAALVETAQAVMDQIGPRLIALAGAEADVEVAFAAVRNRLDGTGLIALEHGLAVEA